jgi:nitric oxide reductase large subunit
MSLLRLACVLTLAIWIGGLAVLGFVVAPTMFSAIEAHDPVGGRTVAAFAFGAVFERFLGLSWGFATLLLARLGARAALGPRPRRFGIRMWTVTAMLAMALGTSLFLVPRINHIRDTTPGTVASLPAGDPVKAAFGRLHAISNGIMLLTLVCGVGLLWVEMKDQ